MMILFYIACVIVTNMLVWFKSDAIIEWGSLLGLSKFVKVNEFQEAKKAYLPLDLNYPTFLRNKYDNFITKMASCPLCLCIWQSNIFCFIISLFFWDLYFVIMTPVVCIMSLIIWGTVNKLPK